MKYDFDKDALAVELKKGPEIYFVKYALISKLYVKICPNHCKISGKYFTKYGLIVCEMYAHPYPEMKPLVSEAMQDLCPLEKASHATGLPVLQGTSVFKDFFNQLQMAQAEKYKLGWLTLAWAGSDVDVLDPVRHFGHEDSW